MKSLTILVIIEFIRSALGGGSSLCEPFASNFNAFHQVMLMMLDNMQQYSTSEYVNWISSFVLDTWCHLTRLIFKFDFKKLLKIWFKFCISWSVAKMGCDSYFATDFMISSRGRISSCKIFFSGFSLQLLDFLKFS